MNEGYWKSFYQTPHSLEPSPFARWSLSNGLQNRSVADLGCGNGRDTFFLAKANHVIGVDPNAPRLTGFERLTVEDYLATSPVVEVLYCRFFLHAIEEEIEHLILEWAARNGAAIYAEFRSDRDKPKPDHARRLIPGNRMLTNLMGRGFHVSYYREGYDLAPFADENPHIVRLIAEI